MPELILHADAALTAAIQKHQRKRESVEALFLRLLNQRTRREELARLQEMKSLARRIQFAEAGLARDQQTLEQLQRQLDEIKASE